jgi:hypothetical protein
MYKEKINIANISIKEFKELPSGESYVVIWYGGLKRNNRSKSVPNIFVFLRKINSDGKLGVHRLKKLALTHLGYVRLGSIWKDGELQSCLEYESLDFDVDFDPDHWSFVSPGDEYEKNIQKLINPVDYELYYERDKNWLVRFPLNKHYENKSLLVPCMEFFFRCYGASLEVKRVLATYTWDEVENRLYDSSYEGSSDKGWHVKLRHRMHKDDVVLLAHLKYDSYSRQMAKSIFAQIETQSSNGRTAFPKIGPWFIGKARLRVEGVWIDGGKTFLGLRITGCSAPSGENIIRTRDQRIKKERLDEFWDDAQVTAIPSHILNREEIVDVTTSEEPDNPSDWVSVQGSEFAILGSPRTVIDRKSGAKTEAYRAIHSSSGEKVSQISGGEPHGGGKDVAAALGHQQRVLESQGVLRDMWNALHFLKESNPDVIRSIFSYSFYRGFNSSEYPEFIALSPVTAEEEEKHEFASGARKWVYLDDQRTRGILVMCVEVWVQISGILQTMPVYIVEIERRLRKVKKNEEEVEAEETFKGLIFTLSDNSQLDEILKQLMFNIRRVNGVVHKIVGNIPGNAKTFKHTPSKDDQIACERTVKLALGKAGVRI